MGGYTTLEFETRDSQHILDITSDVRKVVRDSGVSDGLCLIFSMHTPPESPSTRTLTRT